MSPSTLCAGKKGTWTEFHETLAKKHELEIKSALAAHGESVKIDISLLAEQVQEPVKVGISLLTEQVQDFLTVVEGTL